MPKIIIIYNNFVSSSTSNNVVSSTVFINEAQNANVVYTNFYQVSTRYAYGWTEQLSWNDDSVSYYVLTTSGAPLSDYHSQIFQLNVTNYIYNYVAVCV